MGDGTRAGHVGWLAQNMLAASAGKIHIHLFPLHYALHVFFLLSPKRAPHVITPMESKSFYVAKPSWHRDKKTLGRKHHHTQTHTHTHNET